MMEAYAPARRGSLVGPAILITAGILFLLNNLGLVSWNVWRTLGQLWPLLLVAIGLDMIVRGRGGSSTWASVASLLIVAMLVGTAVVVLLLSPSGTLFGRGAYFGNFGPIRLGQAMVVGGPVRVEQISQPLQGAEQAEVEIGQGVGLLKIQAMENPSGLIEGSVALQGDEEIYQDMWTSGDLAHYALSHRAVSVHTNSPADRTWDLRLNPDVPTRLKVNGGVGKTEMDLTGMQITSLELHPGVSQTEITLPGTGRIQGTIDGGVGTVTLFVPKGMAVKVESQGMLGGVEAKGPFEKRGNSYVTPGYEGAGNRAEIAIKGGIGKVVIQEVSAG